MPPGAGLKRGVAWLRRTRPRALLAYHPRLLLPQLMLFGAPAAPLRALLRRLLAPSLQPLERAFVIPFYLAQLPSAWLRRGAARDPLLHYLAVGKFLNLSPAPGFDPVAWRLDHPDIPKGCAPYLHFLREGGSRSCAEPVGAAATMPDTCLLFDHARGGGSSRYLEGYARELQAQGWRVLRARCSAGGRPLLVLEDMQGPRWFEFGADAAALASRLRELGVRRIVANHLIDLPQDAFEWLPRLAGSCGAVYELLLHDYYYVCPRVNLVDAQQRYCAIAPAPACRSCLRLAGSSAGVVDVADWRARARLLLAGADRVLAPSQDLGLRLAPHFPGTRIEVREPEDDSRWPPAREPMLHADEALRLVVIGALNLPKGYAVVERLARLAAAQGAPLQLELMGSSLDDARLRRNGVRVHGRYREADVDRLLQGCGAHAAFLPAIWPETWSFVQSIALHHGLPVLAFDHGAVAQRLRRLNRATLLPPPLSQDAPALLGALLDWRQQHLAGAGAPC